jgi:F-type H+-transporting ATPase subunit epsilon
MILEIISPEKTLFSGNVDSVTFPGKKSAFTILEKHAPLISSLEGGKIHLVVGGKEQTITISSGFIEVKNNIITVSVEV